MQKADFAAMWLYVFLNVCLVEMQDVTIQVPVCFTYHFHVSMPAAQGSSRVLIYSCAPAAKGDTCVCLCSRTLCDGIHAQVTISPHPTPPHPTPPHPTPPNHVHLAKSINETAFLRSRLGSVDPHVLIVDTCTCMMCISPSWFAVACNRPGKANRGMSSGFCLSCTNLIKALKHTGARAGRSSCSQADLGLELHLLQHTSCV